MVIFGIAKLLLADDRVGGELGVDQPAGETFGLTIGCADVVGLTLGLNGDVGKIAKPGQREGSNLAGDVPKQIQPSVEVDCQFAARSRAAATISSSRRAIACAR